MANYLTAIRGDSSKVRQLIFTDGGGPNAAQRKASTDMARDMKSVDTMKLAIVSGSAWIQGLATAFRWLGFPMRAFAPDRVAEAFAFLSISKAEALDICAAVTRLCSQVEGTVLSAAHVDAYIGKTRRAHLSPDDR